MEPTDNELRVIRLLDLAHSAKRACEAASTLRHAFRRRKLYHVLMAQVYAIRLGSDYPERGA